MFYDPNVKVDYIYGLTDPRIDSADLYEVIRGYVMTESRSRHITTIGFGPRFSGR